MRTPFTFIDPVQLAQIRDLQLLTRTVVEGFMIGLHRSPLHGASIEFAQYRPYVQGDDPRFVDWTLYARTDRLHIKQFQDETNLRCTLLLDASASMGYGSTPITKFQYARMLAACLVMILTRQKDEAGFLAYHHEVLVHLPPRGSSTHLQRILVELERLQPAGQTDAAGALHFIGNLLKPRGMVILISDLLHPLDHMINHLKSLRARRHDVVVFQVSDPAEQTFPFAQPITLLDTESPREQHVVPDEVREEYLNNSRLHFETLRRECLAAEIDIHEFSTSEPLERALVQFFYFRNHSLMTSSLKRTRALTGGRR